jgi:ketosteroid isomerase-like protein
VDTVIGAIIARKKVRSAFDALNWRDLDAFFTDWSEAATYIYPGNLSSSGKCEGKESIREWYEKFMEQFPQAIFDVRNICVQKMCPVNLSTNSVVVKWDGLFTNRDRKEFKNSGVTVVDIEKGRFIKVQQYIFNTEIDRRAWGED